jgi:ribosomal protein S18 acetylase RimI-like enzyme
MNENIKIFSGSHELLDRISPLWEEIKKYHVEKSPHFSKDINSKSFVSRKKELISKAKYLQVVIASNLKEEKDVGYCITTIDHENRGEIDSLFIKKQYRRQGIGKKLTKMALGWLNDKRVVDSSIIVAYGNEDVIDFYKSFGFYPRNIYLTFKL